MRLSPSLPHRSPRVPPRVTVVVCSYSTERLDLLQTCLRSLEAQVRQPDETLLVIDHNGALLERARELFPQISVIANDRQRGASGARNCGIAHARGEVVAFLDDDTTADERWLLELLRPYEDRSVLGTTGRVVPNWPNGRPTWFPPEFDWVVGCTYRGMPQDPAPVRNLWGPMAFRRAVIEDLGGFDETMGLVRRNALGCEETELSIRLHAQHPSGILLYVPAARTTHHLDVARTRVRYFLRRCYGEGQSKAIVALRVGPERALATERTYVMTALPAGLRRCLGQVLTGRFGSLRCAAMILAGLATTTAGYLSGRLSRRARHATTDRAHPHRRHEPTGLVLHARDRGLRTG